MSKLRPINLVYGTAIRSEFVTHEYVLLKEWMLKPLWLKHSLGIKNPVLKLQGMCTNFRVGNESRLATKRITISFTAPIYLMLDRIDEPGCTYQLRIEDNSNG